MDKSILFLMAMTLPPALAMCLLIGVDPRILEPVPSSIPADVKYERKLEEPAYVHFVHEDPWPYLGPNGEAEWLESVERKDYQHCIDRCPNRVNYEYKRSYQGWKAAIGQWRRNHARKPFKNENWRAHDTYTTMHWYGDSVGFRLKTSNGLSVRSHWRRRYDYVRYLELLEAWKEQQELE